MLHVPPPLRITYTTPVNSHGPNKLLHWPTTRVACTLTPCKHSHCRTKSSSNPVLRRSKYNQAGKGIWYLQAVHSSDTHRSGPSSAGDRAELGTPPVPTPQQNTLCIEYTYTEVLLTTAREHHHTSLADDTCTSTNLRKAWLA